MSQGWFAGDSGDRIEYVCVKFAFDVLTSLGKLSQSPRPETFETVLPKKFIIKNDKKKNGVN